MTNKTLSNRLESTEVKSKILEFRRGGLTLKEIGRQVSKDPSYCWRIIKEALDEYREQMAGNVQELVAMELSRLDRVQAAIWGRVCKGENAAIDRFLKISQARRELLGLDAPKRVIAVTPDGEPITPVLIYLPSNGREIIDGDAYVSAPPKRTADIVVDDP